MTGREVRATTSLAGVFALRLLGLFMIYPGFAAYARGLKGATPVMIGLALGGYGLTQGLLQLPYGLLSDRIGRKLVIALGLLLFGAGSVVAALATSIEGVLLGRILQGAGAIGSATLALVADLTREEVRTKAMAMIGMTIGLAFVVAIVVGPVLDGIIGISGIFWLTALFALFGIGIILVAVPAPPRLSRHRDAEAVPALFARVLRNGELMRLDVGIFALHAALTASFLAVPSLIAGTFHLTAGREWLLYLPVLLASVALMVPGIIVAEKSGRMKQVFLASITLLAASLLVLAALGHSRIGLALGLVGFFAAFNVMEAMLPSLVTKTAPAEAKGTATGIYSSAQFLGIFAGGAAGGWALALGGPVAVLGFALAVTLIWLAVASTMRRPPRHRNYLARLGALAGDELGTLAARLRAVPGVIEAVVAPDEGVAYLKIDPSRFDAAHVTRIAGN